ncbi:hypothetical protein WAX74_05150 [Psychrobacillus sp. FJAT-51614]|uniref:Uncharacterized protein n=1 Tax=Psychrobacillus mangrovi TaxID=3117745 RepID=A0ABU8F4S6_9BACI
MKNRLLALLLGCCLFLLFPVQVFGEEKSGLLETNVYHLVGTTGEVVNSVQSIGSEPLSEESLSDQKHDTDGRTEAQERTIPVIEEIVAEVTSNTDSITTVVIDDDDETIEANPEIQVVTPVLRETQETIKRLNTEIKKTVVSGNEEVNDLVEKGLNTIPQKSPKKDTLSNQWRTKIPITPIKIMEVETNQTLEIDDTTEKVVISTNSLDKVEIFENQVMKSDKGIMDGEIFLKIENTSALKEDNTSLKKAKNQKDPEAPVLPFIPLAQELIFIQTTNPIGNGNSKVASTSFTFFTGSDIVVGALPSEKLMKELRRKKWYHKNSYAIIQWIHTPLRKPPESILFYT